MSLTEGDDPSREEGDFRLDTHNLKCISFKLSSLGEEGKGMAREPTGWAVDEYVTAGGKNRVLEPQGVYWGAESRGDDLDQVAQGAWESAADAPLKTAGGGPVRASGEAGADFLHVPTRAPNHGMVKKQDQIPHRVLARMKQLKREVETMDAEAARGP